MYVTSRILNSSYTIRAATADDLAFQAGLYASTREDEMRAGQFAAEVWEQFLEHQFNAQLLHYRQCYPQAEWFIIEFDNQRAGRLILDRASDHLHIMDIALMPDFRGLGIGSGIMREVISEAATKQLPVRLFAFTGERALGLYHRLGFTDVNNDGIHTELVWKPNLET